MIAFRLPDPRACLVAVVLLASGAALLACASPARWRCWVEADGLEVCERVGGTGAQDLGAGEPWR